MDESDSVSVSVLRGFVTLEWNLVKELRRNAVMSLEPTILETFPHLCFNQLQCYIQTDNLYRHSGGGGGVHAAVSPSVLHLLLKTM